MPILTPKQARAMLTKRKRDLRKYSRTLSRLTKLEVQARDQATVVNHAEAALDEALAYAKAHRPKRKRATSK